MTNFLGIILSVISVVIFYYWKEGQRRVQIRVKNEKAFEPVRNKTFLEVIKIAFKIVLRTISIKKEKGYSLILAFQFAYVEYHEDQMKKEEKNALDFVLGKVVILQRNEYDQSPNK